MLMTWQNIIYAFVAILHTSLALTFFYCRGKYVVAKLLRLLAPYYTQSGIIPLLLRQIFAKSTDVLGIILILIIYVLWLVTNSFLGAFAKLPKSNIIFVKSVRPSVCPSVWPSICLHETTLLPLDGFSWNLVLHIFRKFVHFRNAPQKHIFTSVALNNRVATLASSNLYWVDGRG